MPHKERTASSAGTHSMTREQAEPFAIRTLQETFQSYPAREQLETRERVKQLLRDEARRGQRQPSALARMAKPVYGIRAGDL
jgi:hypothetical protein